jgi:Bacterial Ig-like domain (group 3)/Right handed beta helix region
MAKQFEVVGKPAQTALFSKRRRRQRSLSIHPFAFDFLEERQLLATITVNTVSDTNSSPRTLSLRQAIEISDGTLALSSLTSTQQGLVSGELSSPNTIDFNIPSSQGPLYDIALSSALPVITSPVFLNGYSQPGASANTNGPGLADNAVLKIEIDGTNAGIGANGLVVTAGSSTIEGLVIANFSGQSGGTGGTGIVLETSGNDLLAGNFIGTDAAGTVAKPNSIGIMISAGATNNTVGGITPAARNLISGNNGSGIQIGASSDVSATSGNVVAGNYIGTDVTGLRALGNGSGTSPAGDGVDLIGVNSINNTIGGSVAAAGNLISGNAYDGIYVDQANHDELEFNLVGADAAKNFSNTSVGNADNGIELDNAATITISKNLVVNNHTGGIGLFYPQTANDLISNNEIILNDGNGILFCSCGDGGSAIYGNLIGTDATGTVNLGNKGYGINIGSANNTIGGSAAGLANVIAFNTKAGVGLEQLNTDTGNTLSANSIYSNQTLGIDLGDTGVPLMNNAEGLQIGPNHLLNYPVLTSASASSTNTTITGSLTATADQTFTIQFFSNTAAEPSSYGQGQTYIGTTTVSTDSSGHANFTFVAQSNVGGQLLSATATDAAGDTSEFAKNILVRETTVNSPIATTTSLSVDPSPSSGGQEISLTAIVAAADGSVPTGPVTFFANGHALGQASALHVINGQDVATFSTILSTPGSYTITAQYGGDSTHLGSLSTATNDIVADPAVIPTIPTIPTLDGPAVTSVRWVGDRNSSTTIVLQFNQALASGPAQNFSNYTILTTGMHGRFGRGSTRVMVRSAVYNASSDTVTLHTSQPLSVRQRYQLTVNGSSARGVRGIDGIMLDVATANHHGRNQVVILDRQNLVFRPTRAAAKARSRP